MSKSDHTPGPWDFPMFAISDEDREMAERLGMEVPRFHHNDGAVSIMAGSGDERKAVANVLCQTRFKRGEGYRTVCNERDANARLVAAAPDLLAALKWAVTVIRPGSDLHNDMMAAIAKAEAQS